MRRHNDGRYVVVPLLAPANLSVVVDVAEKKIVKSFKTVHPHNCFTPEGGSNTIVYCEERDAYRIHRIDLAKMEVTNEVKVAAIQALHHHQGREDALYRTQRTAWLRHHRSPAQLAICSMVGKESRSGLSLPRSWLPKVGLSGNGLYSVKAF